MPQIMDYADNVVPAYPLPVFKERFHLSRSTFETLTEMLTGCPEFTGGNKGVQCPRLMSASNL